MKILLKILMLSALFPLLAAPKAIAWYGDVLAGERSSGKKYNVKGGEQIRAALRYQLLKAAPGFQMLPKVAFENARGQIISKRDMGEMFPDPGQCDFIDAEIYLTVPARAVKAFFSLEFYGNKGKIRVCEENIHPSRPPVREKMRYSPLPNPGRLTDKQLDAHLAKRPPAHATILRCGEYNTIAVNGREITPSIYLTTGYKTPLRNSMLGAYAQAGVKIVSCSAILGVGRPNKNLTDIWLGTLVRHNYITYNSKLLTCDFNPFKREHFEREKKANETTDKFYYALNFTGYGINRYVGSSFLQAGASAEADQYAPLKLSQIKALPPSKLLVTVDAYMRSGKAWPERDSKGFYLIDESKTNKWYQPDARDHNGGVNVLFADFHAAQVRIANMLYPYEEISPSTMLKPY